MNSLKTWLAIIFGVAFLRIGLLHFTQPEPFDAIIPPYLPFPRFWTLASGILEILLGLGLMLPKMRQRAALCMALLLVLMYPANLNMWVHDIPFGQTRFETRGHIVRLPDSNHSNPWLSLDFQTTSRGLARKQRMQRHKTQLKNSDFFSFRRPIFERLHEAWGDSLCTSYQGTVLDVSPNRSLASS